MPSSMTVAAAVVTNLNLADKLQRFNFTVGAVLFVFLFLFYVDVACVIIPWLSFSVPGILNLLILSSTTAVALCCYFYCMYADPGRVPADWEADAELQAAAVQEVKKKSGAPRYCKKCSRLKPPRSHHCRVCERCVLRMDHHCPWVNNCIGHANYRNFFLLLIYSSAALVHTSGLLLTHAIHFVHSSKTAKVVRVGPKAVPHPLQDPAGDHHLLLHIGLQAFAIAVALPTTIAVVMLLVWHIQMIAANKTTIEHAEGVTAQVKSAGLGRQRHPYNLGWLANCHEILGDNALLWCIPSFKPVPGGIKFPTAFDNNSWAF